MENSGVGQRLVELRGEKSQDAFAAELGISKSSLRRYESEERPPDSAMLIRLAQRGFNVHWLMTGDGPKRISSERISAHADQIASMVNGDHVAEIRQERRYQDIADRLRRGAIQAEKALEADLYMVRHLGIEAGAGSGRYVVGDNEFGALAYRTDLLREMGVNPANAGLVTVRGKSMMNLLHDGDTVLIDRGDREIRSGRCYVFRLGDELVVKYLQRLPDGTVQAISENSEVFKPFVIQLDQDMEVIGRVRSHNHRWD